MGLLIKKNVNKKENKMKKYLNSLGKSWKTTSAGLVAIVAAIAMYINDKSTYIEALTLLLSGIGLILSKDSDISGGGAAPPMATGPGGSTNPPVGGLPKKPH